MFEDGAIVDRFIDGWRKSGDQKFGYLLGQYTEFTDVPLGIRVVVSAIYEPPQVRRGKIRWGYRGITPTVLFRLT